MKTPVPLDELPPPLAPLLGYEFYELLPEGDRFREFLLNPDEEARWKFYARADDLAQDIVDLLDELADEVVHHEPADDDSRRSLGWPWHRVIWPRPRRMSRKAGTNSSVNCGDAVTGYCPIETYS